LTVKNNADFFDIVYRSEDDKQDTKTNDNETKISISGDLSPRKIQPSKEDNSPNSTLQIKQEWVRSLGKVFSILDSKAIKQLLLLLEHPKETTRKMIMLLFQILLQKTQNKIHFVEKCAIGFSPGVYIVSRMKYVYSVSSDFGNVFGCLMAIKRHFRVIKSKLEIENNSLKGTFLVFWLILQTASFFIFFALIKMGNCANFQRRIYLFSGTLRNFWIKKAKSISTHYVTHPKSFSDSMYQVNSKITQRT
jgi:hypothetical protein